MIKIRGKIVTAVMALAVGTSLTACSSVADPDQIGLYYNMGASDGYKFDSCIEPGQAGDYEWNNEVVYLPTSLRSWNILENGGDTDKAIVVASKPELDQPSGVQVKVWSQTAFYLNTFCDKNGGKIAPFWEKIGRRYNANTPDGWAAMIKATLVPPLQKAEQDVIREYNADQLIGNVGGVRAEAQKKISEAFTAELRRITGDDYFCGPAFNRSSATCPAVEIIIVDVDLENKALQDARNEKIRAQEIAAAKVAEAQGQVDAAKKLESLYRNQAWMQLEKAKLQLQAVQACAANPTCTIFIGGNGNIVINGKP